MNETIICFQQQWCLIVNRELEIRLRQIVLCVHFLDSFVLGYDMKVLFWLLILFFKISTSKVPVGSGESELLQCITKA